MGCRDEDKIPDDSSLPHGGDGVFLLEGKTKPPATRLQAVGQKGRREFFTTASPDRFQS